MLYAPSDRASQKWREAWAASILCNFQYIIKKRKNKKEEIRKKRRRIYSKKLTKKA